MKRNQLKLVDGFYRHLLRQNIKAEITNFKFLLGDEAKKEDNLVIRIFSHNFDFIYLDQSENRTFFDNIKIYYMINHQFPIGGGIEDWFIKTKKFEEGLLRKRITGFNWLPSKRQNSFQLLYRISDLLNKDEELKNYLFLSLRKGMPDILISSFNQSYFFWIRMDFKRKWIFSPIHFLYLYSSPSDIKAIEKIAGYFKDKDSSK